MNSFGEKKTTLFAVSLFQKLVFRKRTKQHGLLDGGLKMFKAFPNSSVNSEGSCLSQCPKKKVNESTTQAYCLQNQQLTKVST